jgi:hypothetical protein
METEQLDQLQIKVLSHYATDNHDSYDKHIFVMSVVIDGIAYSIHRNYVDFVGLHRKLRDAYPDTLLAELPLYDVAYIEAILQKEEEHTWGHHPATAGGATNHPNSPGQGGVVGGALFNALYHNAIVTNSPFLKKLMDSKSNR